MPPSKNYGHISRTKKESKTWRWAIAGAVCLWGLMVCLFNTARLAAALGHHPALGSPLFTMGDYRCYWPWKLLEWASEYRQYEAVTRIIDQNYLMGVGVPLVLFLLRFFRRRGSPLPHQDFARTETRRQPL